MKILIFQQTIIHSISQGNYHSINPTTLIIAYIDYILLHNSGVLRKPQSRKEKLEAELKLLQWHKLANEAAIKVSI